MPGAQIDRRWRFPALLAPQFGQYLGERPITMIPDEQAHRIDRLPATAVQFQAALWPIRKALLASERRRVHRIRLF
jgi:hypothetical protein